MSAYHRLICLLSLVQSAPCLRLRGALGRWMRQGDTPGTAWWSAGLTFGCTGCGKCCQMDGDVWIAPEEVGVLAKHLQLAESDFVAAYGRRVLQGWVCLHQSEGHEAGCVFLDRKTNQCGIYDARPVQCRTYPFWPSLVDEPDAWEEEAVLPDNLPVMDPDSERHWSLESGGCEGINHANATCVAADEIRYLRDLARAHWRRFPGFWIKRDTWAL